MSSRFIRDFMADLIVAMAINDLVLVDDTPWRRISGLEASPPGWEVRVGGGGGELVEVQGILSPVDEERGALQQRGRL